MKTNASTLTWASRPGVAFLNLLLAAALAFTLTACGSKRTPENLAKVKNGMTAAQVKEILGAPDRVENATILGLENTTFYYEAKDAKVQVSFINDGVTLKMGSFGSDLQKK